MKFFFLILMNCAISSLCFSQATLGHLTGYTGDLKARNNQIGSATLLDVSGHLFMVTAKHVLQGWHDKPISYTFYKTGKSNDTGNTIEILLDGSSLNQYVYFSDSSDIAVIHIGFPSGDSTGQYELYNIARYSSKVPAAIFHENEIWPVSQLGLGIDVYTLGLPSESERSNQTSVSLVSGITSGFYPDGTFKCQLPVYGGNSGGPVFAYSSYGPSNYNEGGIFLGGNSIYLLGIITEFVPSIDGAKSPRGNAIFLTTNSGFAKAEPIDRVMKLIKSKIF